MKKPFVYVAGDIMSIGSQYELQLICDIIGSKDYSYYSPILNKSINDKRNVTEEENNHLAEKIVEADSKRLEEADIVIFNIKHYAVGTLVELGQCLQMFRDNPNLKKSFYFLYSDIRRDTNLNEMNDRRSWSINQYIYGAVLALSKGRGFMSLEDLKRVL